MAFHRRSVIYKCKILRLMGNCGDFLPKWNRSALFHSLRQNRLGEGELGLTGKILFDIFRDFFILILQIFKQLNDFFGNLNAFGGNIRGLKLEVTEKVLFDICRLSLWKFLEPTAQTLPNFCHLKTRFDQQYRIFIH